MKITKKQLGQLVRQIVTEQFYKYDEDEGEHNDEQKECPACDGDGYADGRCSTCNGTGVVDRYFHEQQQTAKIQEKKVWNDGNWYEYEHEDELHDLTECPRCEGEGIVGLETRCPFCKGKKVVPNFMTEQATNVGSKPDPLNPKVGDIYVSSWGYEQTNIDYYKVVAVSASKKSVKFANLRRPTWILQREATMSMWFQLNMQQAKHWLVEL